MIPIDPNSFQDNLVKKRNLKTWWIFAKKADFGCKTTDAVLKKDDGVTSLVISGGLLITTLFSSRKLLLLFSRTMFSKLL